MSLDIIILTAWGAGIIVVLISIGRDVNKRRNRRR